LLVALVVAVAGGDALKGWLAATAFWTSVPFGGLCLAMMMRVIPGAWREELLPGADAAALLTPLTFILILPVLILVPAIYPWASPAAAGALYLNHAFFAARTIAAVVCFTLLAVLPILRPAAALRVSLAGLILFVLIDSVIAVDWLMSLEPDFHSSGFGLYILSIQLTAALSWLILVRLAGGEEGTRTSLLASLLLTALLLWAYMAFMQYFITWSDNLQPGVRWYARRAGGVWSALEYGVAALGLLPAFLLIFAPVRRRPAMLAWLCGAVLLGKAIEIAWIVLPSAADPALAAGVALLALTGLGLLAPAAFAGAARLRPALAAKASLGEAAS
jgi:hypothetical protein